MLVIAFELNHTQNLYPGSLHFLDILRPPPLLVISRAFDAGLILEVNFSLQHRSNVDRLSNRSTFLRSSPIDFFDFNAKAIFG
jgi:hypothetical protein